MLFDISRRDCPDIPSGSGGLAFSYGGDFQKPIDGLTFIKYIGEVVLHRLYMWVSGVCMILTCVSECVSHLHETFAKIKIR